MKSKHLVTLAVFLALEMIALSSPAQARGGGRDRQVDRSGTYTDRRGSGTFSQSVNRQAGMTQRNSSWTSPSGGTGSHTATNTYSNGTVTHTGSTTYANGATTSSQGAATKTTNGYDYNGTVTGPKGQTDNVNKIVTKDDGTRTADTTITNPTTGKSSTIDKTYNRTGTGSRQVDTTVTGPNGKTATSTQTFASTGNGYTQNGTVTGPNGATATDNRGVSYTHNGNGSTTRTVTGSVTADGKTVPIANTETYTTTRTTTPPPQD